MNLDPGQTMALTAVAGVLWPLVQAALDKPWWTPARRRAITLAAIVVLAAGSWAVSAYPANAQAIVTQVAAAAGFVLGAFNILKALKINGVSIIDWAGLVTPGGVERDKGKHEADEPQGA